jgi:hypothetical protein
VMVIEILLDNEMRGNPKQKLSGPFLAFAFLRHIYTAVGVAAYRISSFLLVNPRKCNIQAMQAWTLSSVRFSFFAMSRSLKPWPTK